MLNTTLLHTPSSVPVDEVNSNPICNFKITIKKIEQRMDSTPTKSTFNSRDDFDIDKIITLAQDSDKNKEIDLKLIEKSKTLSRLNTNLEDVIKKNEVLSHSEITEHINTRLEIYALKSEVFSNYLNIYLSKSSTYNNVIQPKLVKPMIAFLKDNYDHCVEQLGGGPLVSEFVNSIIKEENPLSNIFRFLKDQSNLKNVIEYHRESLESICQYWPTCTNLLKDKKPDYDNWEPLTIAEIEKADSKNPYTLTLEEIFSPKNAARYVKKIDDIIPLPKAFEPEDFEILDTAKEEITSGNNANNYQVLAETIEEAYIENIDDWNMTIIDDDTVIIDK